MKVYIVEGWFGDHEWIEAVYGRQDEAEYSALLLNQVRESDKVPAYMQGHCKFSSEPYEVL